MTASVGAAQSLAALKPHKTQLSTARITVIGVTRLVCKW
jgi:hypothetical protein